MHGTSAWVVSHESSTDRSCEFGIDKVDEVKNPENFADVLYQRPLGILRSSQFGHPPFGYLRIADIKTDRGRRVVSHEFIVVFIDLSS